MDYVRGATPGRKTTESGYVQPCPVTAVQIQSDFTEACVVIESRTQPL